MIARLLKTVCLNGVLAACVFLPMALGADRTLDSEIIAAITVDRRGPVDGRGFLVLEYSRLPLPADVVARLYRKELGELNSDLGAFSNS